MEQQSTERLIESRPDPSRVVWEQFEAFARQGVQDLLQQVLRLTQNPATEALYDRVTHALVA